MPERSEREKSRELHTMLLNWGIALGGSLRKALFPATNGARGSGRPARNGENRENREKRRF